MSAQCSDFIVKRKRKRPSAIDPCPGFYTDPTTPVIKIEQDLVPPICVLTPPPPSSPVPTVTSVDAFLRQSYSKPPRKVYTRLQKRPRHDSLNDNFVPSDDETTKQPNPPRMKRRAPARVLSHPKLKKPGFGKRMIEAIVSTHVQPSDSFMMSMIGDGSGRQPLRFVPGDDPPSRILKRGSLVDPKRIVMHRSSFPSGTAHAADCTVTKKKKERRPMSTWRPEPTGHFAAKRGTNAVCLPLEFIDFREAEALYAAQKRSRQEKQRDISQEKRKVRRNASAAPNPLVFVPSTLATPIVSKPFPNVFAASYSPLPFITTTASVLTPACKLSPDNLHISTTSPIDQSSDLFFEESLPISSIPAFDELDPKSDPIADQQPIILQENSQPTLRDSYEYRARILCADTPMQTTRTIAVTSQSQFLEPATTSVPRIQAPREAYQTLPPAPALLQTSLPPAQEHMPHILHEDSSRQMPTPVPLQASRPPAQESIPRHTTTSSKLLKPLASFLDDFSKIARSAAIQVTQPRPRTAVSRPPRTRPRRPMTATAARRPSMDTLERTYPSFSASDAFEIDGTLEGDEDLEGEYVAKSSRYPGVISLLGDRKEEWVLC